MKDEIAETEPTFRWPVAMTHRFDAEPDRLWDVISRPGNLELCHPFCARNPVKVWPGPESRDEIHYLSGWVYERRLVRWYDGVGYDLQVGGRGEPVSLVSWRIRPQDRGGSSLTIEVRPHVVQRLPVVLRWAPHVAYVRLRLRPYLSSVLRGFEWHMERGEPVPRNQFGTHPWFS